MKKTLFQSVLIFSVLYTLITIFSSVLQLMQGQETDTNTHLLNRAKITAIGVITLQLILHLNFKWKPLNIILPYCISMGLVFLYVFYTSFFEELHPNAYRDIFLNYTVIFIVVTAAITLYTALKHRKNKNK